MKKLEKLEKIFLGRSIVGWDNKAKILMLDNNVEIRFVFFDKGWGDHLIDITCNSCGEVIDKISIKWDQEFEEGLDEYDDVSQRTDCFIDLHSKNKKTVEIEVSGWENGTVYLTTTNKETCCLVGYPEEKDLKEIFTK